MKKILLIAIAFFGLAVLARADGFTVIGSRADQNPTDIIDWGQLGAPGTSLNGPQIVSSFNGNLALVADLNAPGTMFTAQEGTGTWVGNFDYGENLLWTGNSNFGVGGSGPLGMLLENPVGSVGFEIQTDFYGPFTVGVELFDTSFNPLGFFTFNGVSNGNEDGSALFIGLGDTTGVNIGGMFIGTDSGPGNEIWANDFAIDDASLTYTTALVPEPASILLLGGGLLGLLGVRRKVSV